MRLGRGQSSSALPGRTSGKWASKRPHLAHIAQAHGRAEIGDAGRAEATSIRRIQASGRSSKRGSATLLLEPLMGARAGPGRAGRPWGRWSAAAERIEAQCSSGPSQVHRRDHDVLGRADIAQDPWAQVSQRIAVARRCRSSRQRASWYASAAPNACSAELNRSDARTHVGRDTSMGWDKVDSMISFQSSV